mgnify:CR=1 FL=1
MGKFPSIDFQEEPKAPEGWAAKNFSETVCENCSEKIENESKPMPLTDSMGREIFWEQE